MARLIDCLIVEDEAMAAQRLERFVRASLGENLGSINHAQSLEDAIPLARALSEKGVIFLDLNLFGADGFEIFEADIQSPARTIVVSADQSRAIDAFAHGVIDFVPKPFTQDRVEQAVQRALAGRDPLQSPVKFLGGAPPGGGVKFIPLENVVALHGADDYVEIEDETGKRLLTRKTLNELETMLNDAFFRIHRSHIINRAHVEKYKSSGAGRHIVKLKSGAELPVGRARLAEFKAWMNS